mmetsp:Transcript_14643/g.39192  ORF Transcript_14643/g.39192 Transcript_14643/m.39192 type:complete len:531 (+) Transcript_14643:102-1694(+)
MKAAAIMRGRAPAALSAEASALGLKDASLLRVSSFVGGKFVARTGSAESSADGGENDDNEDIVVVNPADGSVVARVQNARFREVQDAIDAAAHSQPAWAAKSPAERSAVLRQWHDLIKAHEEDLARIMTLENGKPLSESLGEIRYGASYVQWYAEESLRMYGEWVASGPQSRALIIRQPVGVCAAITPWNFPCAMITRKVAPALAAGCSMVVKPSELTPLSALALAELASRAGLDAGLFSVVAVSTQSAPSIGKLFCTSPLIRKISFTGSTAVGEKLLELCAPDVKRVSMELGGLAAFVVCDDADLDSAVSALLANKFRGGGQTCVCTNRVYAQSGIYDAFVERLAARVQSDIKLQPGLEPLPEGVRQAVGPLISDSAVDKVERHVKNAKELGGRVLVGGERATDLGAQFFQPTVIRDCSEEMLFAREETFGPVAGVMRFDTDAEVVARVNAVPFGLANYVFTQNIGRAMRISEALESGMVGVNDAAISDARMPFGGIKKSGMGREGASHGLHEYTNLKYVLLGNLGAPL